MMFACTLHSDVVGFALLAVGHLWVTDRLIVLAHGPPVDHPFFSSIRS